MMYVGCEPFSIGKVIVPPVTLFGDAAGSVPYWPAVVLVLPAPPLLLFEPLEPQAASRTAPAAANTTGRRLRRSIDRCITDGLRGRHAHRRSTDADVLPYGPQPDNNSARQAAFCCRFVTCTFAATGATDFWFTPPHSGLDCALQLRR